MGKWESIPLLSHQSLQIFQMCLLMNFLYKNMSEKAWSEAVFEPFFTYTPQAIDLSL